MYTGEKIFADGGEKQEHPSDLPLRDSYDSLALITSFLFLISLSLSKTCGTQLWK